MGSHDNGYLLITDNNSKWQKVLLSMKPWAAAKNTFD